MTDTQKFTKTKRHRLL